MYYFLKVRHLLDVSSLFSFFEFLFFYESLTIILAACSDPSSVASEPAACSATYI